MVKRENLVEISRNVAKNGCNYIGEIKVLDKSTNKEYYVVCQLNDLFYKTFESSWIDYVKGKTTKEPVMVEGDTYMFFDYFGESEDINDDIYTPFRLFYLEALAEAEKPEHELYIKHKYSHMKKPSGIIKYEILDADDKEYFACGPMGDGYQIHFYLPEEKREVYVFHQYIERDIYVLSDFDIIHSEDENLNIEGKSIEYLVGKGKIKKSKYYDLYFAMEQYEDGLLKIEKNNKTK